MLPFPHRYTVSAHAAPTEEARLESEGLSPIATAPPEAFGGPGNRWSPETLLVGAVADCFVLTFRAVAQASKLSWSTISCEAMGTLDRVDRINRFTEVHVRATLRVPPGTDEARALATLERAERICLISNSLSATVHLDARVDVAEPELV